MRKRFILNSVFFLSIFENSLNSCKSYNFVKVFYYDRPIYTFSSQLTDSISIYASSIIGVNTTTVKNFLDIVVFKYDIYGNILDFGYLGKDFF